MKKVILNGFNWFVDMEKRLLFENENQGEGVDFKFLTEGELRQIYDQVFYQIGWELRQAEL